MGGSEDGARRLGALAAGPLASARPSGNRRTRGAPCSPRVQDLARGPGILGGSGPGRIRAQPAPWAAAQLRRRRAAELRETRKAAVGPGPIGSALGRLGLCARPDRQAQGMAPVPRGPRLGDLQRGARVRRDSGRAGALLRQGSAGPEKRALPVVGLALLGPAGPDVGQPTGAATRSLAQGPKAIPITGGTAGTKAAAGSRGSAVPRSIGCSKPHCRPPRRRLVPGRTRSAFRVSRFSAVRKAAPPRRGASGSGRRCVPR